MNVENSREADPVRAEALAGPLRAAHIDVALILICIRVRRSKRRMRRSTCGKVIVDWPFQPTFPVPCEVGGFLSDAAVKGGLEMASAYPIPGDQGSIVLLWAGGDPALHSTLLEQLESAGIRFSDKTLGDDEIAPAADPLPIDFKPRFGFEVLVLSGDFDAAQAVLEKLLNEEPADMEIPAQDDDAPRAEPTLVSATELHPTVTVWSGTSDRIAEFLTASLQENEIPIHLETAGDVTSVLVSAANEARAREIVREVVNAAPPE